MSRWTDRFSLAGKRALVTGASKGIGLEPCQALADAGADIVAVARERVGLKAASDSVEACGRHCLTIEADLASTAETKNVAAKALASWGTIDILVNNAGVALIAPLLEANVEDWDATMAV